MLFLVNIALTGNALLGVVVVLILLLVGLIFFMRSNFASFASKEHASRPVKSLLANRTKYEQVNALGKTYTMPFSLLGLALAVGLSTLAFGWTQYDKAIYIPDDALEMDDDIEVEPPRTAEPPPPPPPPPPPVIEEVPEEEIEEEEEPEFVDQSVEEETVVDEPPPPPKKEAPPPPPPPPPPPEPEVDEIFKVVEEMPKFPGCESAGDEAAKKQCANKKMLEFIYKNIKYPAIARENGVEGTCVVRFVIDKSGKITVPEVVRDIGAGCGAEALRVVKMMPTWNPGKQRGRAVKVQFNLPVKFKLQ